ncbi:GTP 3',8-cyclase MoaA [Sinanaerobacter chloroacetimidivorans]|jgi:cyclic pyranopterin phosphate synthase|uniref:GTP 3',8-cyclase n=1 Tax=Sinanaerobacter chloroacetimidivorans TaxID=2818044 RepID=A0A8J8B439_9FIRM|nr:GTP 3',8-cyclase MoaA [Sinanaerobacter chloroacetimidivorans]MBR0600352.1 GTP 3',8-cyclase MoaA [Sinanaerobacter chloroacetimidivorans]
MKDSFGREISYMRISVTDRCNLRCKYCMPEEGVENLGHDKILTFEEITRIVKASVELGITKFRLTGGEPLARRGIVDLVDRLATIEGVKELTMTTNGILLGEFAHDLKKAGLNRVNISLDTLQYEKYEEITRGGNLDDVFAGIQAALEEGLTPVKLNVVAISGFNDDEILDFVQLTCNHPLDIRFIELMPIGHAAAENHEQFLSSQEIKKKLPCLIPQEQNGVAEYYRYPEALGKIGFISPMSCHFCNDCNKIRLTADGKLKPCLHTNQEFDLHKALKTDDDEMLKEAIKEAILGKEDRHHLNEGADPIQRDMNKIGG